MNSETVKPMPAAAATPNSCARGMPSGSVPPARSAASVAPLTPSSLPSTRPATIAHVSRLESASPSTPPPSAMPALASANSGTTTNALHGCRRCSTRSPIATGSSRPTATPAIVACTPDSCTAIQSTIPSGTHSRGKNLIATTSAAAASSHSSDTASA